MPLKKPIKKNSEYPRLLKGLSFFLLIVKFVKRSDQAIIQVITNFNFFNQSQQLFHRDVSKTIVVLSVCALNQFRRNPLKNQFKKRKNPSKRCSNSIHLKFFQRDFKNGTNECGIKKVRDKRIRNYFLNFKLKFGIFNSMAVTLYLSFHM